ncbi:hypothetical protein OQX61_02085 [Pedobacter sp. PLR]|uniref:hypothetical protein n=1 Tax=Pedobacter sp. PLR TaxID=2994465 RepID=UPI00224754D0|nr:hypothetical protein [Pedobacter sp. PLR]MCX2450048.1 hypothetical protein [Pedobacter sp. PLR]
MLEQFSWRDFILVMGVLTAIWYLGIILIFYREQFCAFLVGKRFPTGVALESVLQQKHKGSADHADDLMGKSKLPEGVHEMGIAELSFAGAESDLLDQVGLVPDLLEELKQIFKWIETSDGNKQDFFKRISELRISFPRISSNPNLDTINTWITQHAPFHLSNDELESLWD